MKDKKDFECYSLYFEFGINVELYNYELDEKIESDNILTKFVIDQEIYENGEEHISEYSYEFNGIIIANSIHNSFNRTLEEDFVWKSKELYLQCKEYLLKIYFDLLKNKSDEYIENVKFS